MPVAWRAELPWQKSTTSPFAGAERIRTATIVFAPGRNCAGSASSTRSGRQQQQLAALHRLVLLGRDDGADDAREDMAYLADLAAAAFGRMNRHVGMRARNHLDADHFADRARGLGAGVGGRFDGRDIAGDDSR